MIDEATAKSKYWVEEPPIQSYPDAVALIRQYRPEFDTAESMTPMLKDIRQRAWEIKYYPCVGLWHFFKFGMVESPIYPEIVPRLQKGQRILDIGCFMGFDSRKLIVDGAPSESTTNMDLEEAWFPLSYELFRDEDTYKGEFFGNCDINDPKVYGEGSTHHQRYDMIYAGYFLHLFPLDKQGSVLRNLVQMLKPVSGSMLFGNTAGTAKVGGHVMKSDFMKPEMNEKGEMVRPAFMFHSTATVVKLFEESIEGSAAEWEILAEQSQFDTDTGPTKSFNDTFKDAEIRELDFVFRRK